MYGGRFVPNGEVLDIVRNDGVACGDGIDVFNLVRSDAEVLVELTCAVHDDRADHFVPAAGENVETIVRQVGNGVDSTGCGGPPGEIRKSLRVRRRARRQRRHADIKCVHCIGVFRAERRIAEGLYTAVRAAGDDSRTDKFAGMRQVQLDRHKGPGRKPRDRILIFLYIITLQPCGCWLKPVRHLQYSPSHWKNLRLQQSIPMINYHTHYCATHNSVPSGVNGALERFCGRDGRRVGAVIRGQLSAAATLYPFTRP